MKTIGDIIYSEKEISPWVYPIVWFALLGLLVLTWRVSYSHLSDWNLVIALAIGVAKCSLVIWYFMELRSAPKLALLLFGMALVMAFIAAVLTLTDYTTRWHERLAPDYDQSHIISITD